MKVRFGLVGCVIAVAATSAACSSGGTTGGNGTSASGSVSSAPTSAVDATLVAKLPAAIKSAGAVKIASDATYPPMEFQNAGQLTGFDIDLGNAIAQLLGVKVTWTNLSAAAIIPGLSNGRFDAAITAAQDLPSRRPFFTFVDYLNAGSDLMVASGNPKNISDFTSLCGLKLGVQAGTAQLLDAKKQQSACGSNQISIQTFQTNDQANLALSSGRVDAVYAQSVVNAYVLKTASGKYQVVGRSYDATPVGVVLPKGSALLAAVQGAVEKLLSNGTYSALIQKWNLQTSAVEKVTVNGQ